MRILHISKYYPPYRGGIEDICFSFVQFLKPEYEEKVVCFNDSCHSILSDVDGVEVMRAGTLCELASQPLSFSFFFILRKYIRTFVPEIIHLHLPNPLACVYLLCLLPAKTKLVLHWHSDIVAQKYLYKLFTSIEKAVLKRADKIIVTSPQYLEYSYPLSPYKEKVIVIPNIISTDKMKLNASKDTITQLKKQYGNKPIVFFMGRHVPYKGIEYLIESEKYITSECVVLIAGSGPSTEELKKSVHSERIKFIGKIPDREINVYMGAASVFAFPSITKNEAFGVALAEAMYCKVPPVTFTIEGSGVNWVNLNGVTGIEVANKDAKAFGEAIDTLLKNDSLRKLYAENSHNRVVEMFTMQAVKKQLLELYKNLS